MDFEGPVVIIDDDQDDQELLRELTLELIPGRQIRSFFNGRDSLTYLKTTSEKPFIIICDMNMPIMNGLELLEAVHGDYSVRSKSIPFLFFSTAADQKSVQLAYDLGVQGFFKKPDSVKELRRILNLSFDFWKNCIHPNHAIFKK